MRVKRGPTPRRPWEVPKRTPRSTELKLVNGRAQRIHSLGSRAALSRNQNDRSTITVRRDYLHYIKKYNRFEKRHKKLSAHMSPAFLDVELGDQVRSRSPCAASCPAPSFVRGLCKLQPVAGARVAPRLLARARMPLPWPPLI